MVGANTLALRSKSKNVSMTELLIQYVITNIHASESQKQAPLHVTAEGLPSNAKPLRRVGPIIDATDGGGNTPLHTALKGLCDHDDPDDRLLSTEIVQKLLRQEAKTQVRNNAGDTAMHIAVQTEDSSVVRLLLKSRADIALENVRDRTTLRLAKDTLIKRLGPIENQTCLLCLAPENLIGA